MAKDKKVLKGGNLWDALDGKKSELKEEIDVKIGDVEGTITVVFRDLDEIQKVEKKVQEELPEKPEVSFKGFGKIKLPSDEYPQFNEHDKAKEWEEKVEPYRKKANYRKAYEFIADEEKPHEDPEKGTEMLQERLRYMDIIRIVNKGMELSGLDRQLDEARKNS